ncbi:MAG: hypothetical protein A2Z20_09400 [Bdellovibrionales bacterium RBG_16_40_8]|nr:MAG: hypothetical protein A2Z20_09400 [Bdellovibrionales bacterium RBG_16_40_8]
MSVLINLFAVALSFAHATESPTASVKSFDISYASAEWNKSSKTIDSAFMFLLDKNTGKIAKISVDETEPDSSIFSGRFSLNWTEAGQIAPEVYIPPKNLRNDSRAVESFNAILQSGNIKSQPLIIKRNKGVQVLEVYDTPEQAAKAREVYNQELAANKKAEQAKLVKPQASENSVQVAQMAAQASAVAKLAQEAAQRESDRLRLEQLEQQKMIAKRQEQAKMAMAEKMRRQAQAEDLSRQAITHYMKAEFNEAEDLFRKSVELDPDNKENYYMFGVSLYRVNKFDDALITLKLSEPNAKTDLEKKYYMGLIHYRLKELASAQSYFADVKKTNDPTLSVSAAFYEGLILFAEDNLIKAQASFEYVLDNSKDPALDKKAEEYIEKIARLSEFKKMASKKIILHMHGGLSYDSNILLTSNNDTSTSTPSNKGGERWTLSGDAEYRFFYRENYDLSGKFAITNTQSFSTDFVQADPLAYTLTMPVNFKGMWLKKGYKLGLAPGYEMVYLDANATGGRPKILNTAMINIDFMQVMKDDWFSSYNIDIRDDDALLPSDVVTNADALKLSFKKTETVFLDSSKKRAVIGSLGYVANNAKGDEKKYSRIELSAIYAAPIVKFRNTTWNGGLNYYLQNFEKSADSRKDNNTSIIFGLNKIVNEAWSYTANASYTTNTSNVETSTYDQYVLMGLINYTWSH